MNPRLSAASLRVGNLLLLLLWLQGLKAEGLLVSLRLPAAVFGLYALGSLLLALWRELPPNARVAPPCADIFLIAWAAHWSSAPFGGVSLAMFLPVVLAARTLRPMDAAVVAGAAAGLGSALALWSTPAAKPA